VEDIDFGVNFVARNSKQIAKFGFGRKNQLHPQF
jgi:hypothetical protein